MIMPDVTILNYHGKEKKNDVKFMAVTSVWQ